ncbi:hypothetical protein AB5N19_11078 [Seiridium cardinale]|uniref:Uncharacterized protein n=1 Tax=Seiridium cardinale TaxID=138064 RepID=A0ABR2XIN7_9PEZI
MLEKTAASLEPCGLQRVLPVATKSFRSRRQLHTGFWQHGAADVELTNAWQVLMHGVFDSGMDTASSDASSTMDPRYPSLRASSFLLDFLYPTGTVAFLRRFSPVASDRLDIYKPSATFAKVSPRLYSSSAPAREPEHDRSDAANTAVGQARKADGTVKPVQTRRIRTSDKPNRSIDDKPKPPRVGHDAIPDSQQPGAAEVSYGSGFSQEDLIELFGDEKGDHLEELRKLLISDDAEDADKVWYHYTLLDEESKQHYLGQTLVFLSKTGRVTDSWKISELFQKLDPSRWDSYSFLAGLEAEMNLQNTQQAQGIFKKGLQDPKIDQLHLVNAFDLMLAAALKSSSRQPLYNLWLLYDKMAARLDFQGITSQLSRVSTVPNIADIVIGLRPYIKKIKSLNGIQSLKKLLVRRALAVCPEHQVLTLLRMTDDPLAYEEFIRNSRGAHQDRKVLLTQVYKIYRGLPESCPSHAVLHTIFHAYASMLSKDTKFPGIEMLWGDWATFHQTRSRRAYQKFLGFYASVGDKKHVYQLWTEYIEVHGSANVLEGDDTFAHLLQVHAVRQEISEVQRIFDEISTKFRLQPNRYCWSILLNAYTKAGDYDGAITTFEKLCENLGGMDRVSVGTLMRMASERGDLAFTVDLYRRARQEHIPTNDVPILCNLIDAYCHNDLFDAAEDLCVRAAGGGLKEPKLWNTVLHAYAIRRNLVGINRLLGRMTDLEVPYNQYTYQELLIGLSLCRQSQHALHLLAVAIQNGVFEVNEEHFHIVMGAFIKSGEVDLAVRIHKLMQQCGLRDSADSLIELMTAFSRWSHLPHKRRQGHSQQALLGAALSRFYKAYGIRNVQSKRSDKSQHSSQTPATGNLLRGNKQAYHFSRIIYIFTQMKDYVKVQELIDMYRYVAYGNAASSEPLPIRMLNSIMWANLSEKKYDELEEIWKTVFAMAQEGALSPEWSEDMPHTERVSPRFRYILNDAIKVMQKLYIEQNDTESLQRLIEEVREAGFEVDSKNWNLQVQGLVQCHAYGEAFEICEKWLMPNWTGWARARQKANMKNQVPLDLRRKGGWQRHLRPVSHTLYYLAKGYLELDKMAPWSREAGGVLASVKTDYPRCFGAISSMVRNGTVEEQRILGDNTANLPVAEGGEYDEEASVGGLQESVDEEDWSVPMSAEPAEGT